MTSVAERVKAILGPAFDPVVDGYLNLVDPEDLDHQDPQRVAAWITSLRSLADGRVVGTSAVEVISEPGGREVLQVVTDDMPFLVDSVSAACRAAGREIELVFHPQFAVERDGQQVAESWMTVVLEPDFAPVRADLSSGVAGVLDDVRRSVRDWPAMRERMASIVEQIRTAPPVGIGPEECTETADLLEWLLDDHLTFLGYREYALVERDGDTLLEAVPGSGLGLLIDAGEATSTSFATLPQEVREKAREPHLLVMTKSNALSPVHRAVHMDYIGIKSFDGTGRVIGERRFLGLFTSSLGASSVLETPVIRRKALQVAQTLGLVEGSHHARDLQHFLESYPRDELFAIDVPQLSAFAAGVLQMQNRRQTRLFARVDDYGRFAVCLVYLPRDRYTTQVRQRIGAVLQLAFGGESVEFTARVTESPLARLHYVVRMPSGTRVPEVDLRDLEGEVAAATRSWWDDVTAHAVAVMPESEVGSLLHDYADAFPEAYKEDFEPHRAVEDALTIERLEGSELDLSLYEPERADDAPLRFRIITVGPAMSLTRVLPMLQNLGVEVLDERPYPVERSDGRIAWILDFGIAALPADVPNRDSLPDRFRAAFRASWDGRCDSDQLNALVLRAGLKWREVVVLRAYGRHMRQGALPFGLDYIERALLEHPRMANLLIELFWSRLDPVGGRHRGWESIDNDIRSALDSVRSLDQDRILRGYRSLVLATLRTNFFARDIGTSMRTALGFKLDPRGLEHLPAPRPLYEMWVYSPRVEGVHLRFGSVARGGLRWSDRPEDFRTEILGLVKAQEVKNAIIVPVGAKGGFLPKQLPDAAVDRDAWMTEGKAAYREFVSALLSMTDNLIDGEVVPPSDTRRLDGDDPYLVVAADKGTATFSDLANSIAHEYRFWLGDAFASGGSQGYDHKGMGITARGAWESVKRHFREIGIDTQTQDFTVVGIGDMSGDVFGNGMLLSPHIRLIAAFDHRDIFIDPNPDPTSTFVERRRLFDLPRSSWQDYDVALLSAGGGVYSRSAKSIDLSAEARASLGLDGEAPLVPSDVVRAILAAPVDLLWNGGIGTYVRARSESNLDVGDKANDVIRIYGDQLRCTVVGEGGNLGFTQSGRIEAARHGVRLNTDAIDNSAGVDTSDHEVNLKILLDMEVTVGRLTADQRNDFLRSMTDDVAEQVLDDNYRQNLALGNARAQATDLITVHQRLMHQLEREGRLDRALERLPDDEQIARLIAAGEGLCGPELAVLLAYSKISLTAALSASAIGDDSWFASVLRRYFPPSCVERFSDRLWEHPLRASIIATVACNDIINLGGITFAFRAMEESGATAPEVVRAAMAAMAVFSIPELRTQINSLDGRVPTSTQIALHLELRRMFDRATRWFLQTRGGSLDVGRLIEDFAPVVGEFADLVTTSLRGNEATRYEASVERFVEGGAPAQLSRRIAALLDTYTLLDIRDLAARIDESPATIIPLYFAVSERFGIDRMLLMVTSLPRDDHWSAQARLALRVDLYAVLASLTASACRSTSAAQPTDERLAAWTDLHAGSIARALTTVDQVFDQAPDIATLSVALRVMRNLVAQTNVSSGGDSSQ